MLRSMVLQMASSGSTLQGEGGTQGEVVGWSIVLLLDAALDDTADGLQRQHAAGEEHPPKGLLDLHPDLVDAKHEEGKDSGQQDGEPGVGGPQSEGQQDEPHQAAGGRWGQFGRRNGRVSEGHKGEPH